MPLSPVISSFIRAENLFDFCYHTRKFHPALRRFLPNYRFQVMKSEIKTVSSTRSVISVSITSEELEKKRTEVASDYAKEVSIPGFRPGKAPVALVLRKYGTRIGSDAESAVLRESFDKAVKESGREIFEIAGFAPQPAEDGFAVSGEFTVDFVPQFELPSLDAIPVDYADTKVSDNEVDEWIASVCRMRGTHEPLSDGAELMQNDTARLNLTGTVDGKPLAEAIDGASPFGSRDGVFFVVGGEYSIIPGLSGQLVGKKVGDQFETDIEFPQDFYVEAMRGVKAHYSVVVASGEKFIPAALDDKLFQSMGVKDLESLKANVRASLESRAKQLDRTRRINEVAEYLAKAVSFDPPEGALERLTEENLSALLRTNMDKGIAKEDLSKERDRLTEAAKQRAVLHLRADIVLDAIAKDRGTKLTDTEFNLYFSALVQNGAMDEAGVKAVAKDRSALRRHYQAALREKVLAELFEKAVPTPSVAGK